MSSSVHHKVTLTSESTDRQTSGVVELLYWNSQERLKRALRFGGISFGIGIASALIPLLHFILVPFFLLAAPVIAIVLYRQESVVLGGQGSCPSCEKPFLVAQSSPRFPIQDLCGSCQKRVEIRLSDPTT